MAGALANLGSIPGGQFASEKALKKTWQSWVMVIFQATFTGYFARWQKKLVAALMQQRSNPCLICLGIYAALQRASGSTSNALGFIQYLQT